MKTSLSWIKAYVPGLECTDKEFLDAMTLSGTKAETCERLDKNLEKIVVGHILKIEQHPDADKLVVCQVDVGSETVQIVTGATNMKEDDLVPVVLDGGRVAGGHDGGEKPEEGIKIKAGKLRGVESKGMMCSIEELGSTKEFYPEAPEDGLYIFGKDSGVKPGDDAVAAMGLNDSVFEFEITSNRVDCYAVLGVAREAAATFDKEFCPPEVKLKEEGDDAASHISVEIQDGDLCSRYCARVCTDIEIAPSPKWMQRRLAACGVRPINNLVDITNYVMLEYGQPMHAFDLDTVAGNRIIVRRAKDGEKFTTLDGVEREMDKDVIMICDAEKEIGIGGIMGGENTMITGNVKSVLFEAATFNGPNIRKSAKRIGLRTDASSFFEKGLDPANASAAIDRACQLVEELGCGKVCKGMVEAGAPLKEPVRIGFDEKKINAMLGTDISKEDMVAYLKRVELEYDSEKNEIIVPSFRQDVLALCDLAEEVARFYGYDRIPATLPSGFSSVGKRTKQMEIERMVRDTAREYGFSQAYCYSFESPKVFDKLLLKADAKEREAITISNPLGEDFSIMRTMPVNGILTSLSVNFNRRNRDVRLYETGNVYIPKALPLTELPDERMTLTLGFYGDGDFYDMKGVVEEILSNAGILTDVTYDAAAKREYLHPGRQASVMLKDKEIGWIGEAHPAVCDNYDIDTRVYLAVLDIPSITENAGAVRVYQGIAKFPALNRDISMVVPKEVHAGDIEKMIMQRGGKNLESVTLFDVYEGEQIKDGFKSMAYALSFRNRERTLNDEDVNASMRKIVNGLNSMNIELRS